MYSWTWHSLKIDVFSNEFEKNFKEKIIHRLVQMFFKTVESTNMFQDGTKLLWKVT